MKKEQLQNKVLEWLKENDHVPGDFTITGFTKSSSKNYKVKLDIDFTLHGYGDDGASINAMDWDHAIEEIAEYLIGKWDYNDCVWL